MKDKRKEVWPRRHRNFKLQEPNGEIHDFFSGFETEIFETEKELIVVEYKPTHPHEHKFPHNSDLIPPK